MIALARYELGIPVLPDELDPDPWALNCENGTVDLQTGQLREHDRADLITKLVPVAYDPEAEAPRFEKYLKEVLLQDRVVGFVRRYAGYSLTGNTRERIFAILHGSGKNGKTTLVDLLQDVAGDYATTTDPETILAKRHQGVGNDVAALKGARFVASAEVERGRALAESKIKALTGSDTISARFLYAEPFTFKPEFKLWLSTNNKPEVGGTDDAIWDRIRLIPFTERFDGDRQDPELPDKLREERPGVLAWMVRGCLEWQRDGLGEPEEVRDATEAYRAEMDVLADFIGDRCVEHPDAWCRFSDLFEEYEEWCRESGETAKSKRKFGAVLKDRGFPPDKGAQNVSIRRGIALRDDRDPGHPDSARVTQPEHGDNPESAHKVDGAKREGNPVTEHAGNGNPETACKSWDSEKEVTQGYSETTNSGEKRLMREVSQNGVTNGNSVTSVVSPPLNGRRLTDEEAERVKGLIAQGVAPTLARAQVLGEEDEWLQRDDGVDDYE
jgi:putative DNA primase/helicase